MLELSPDPDVEITFQVVHLWLNHSDVPEVNKLVYELSNKMASYKLVPLTHQIFSRLGSSSNATNSTASNSNDTNPSHTPHTPHTTPTTSVDRTPSDFQYVLRHIVFRMCEDHPHHTLSLLFALQHQGPRSLLLVSNCRPSFPTSLVSFFSYFFFFSSFRLHLVVLHFVLVCI